MQARGFTLMEVTITVGISLGLIALATVPLSLAREQTHAAASTLNSLISDARGAARANNGAGSGAVLTVISSAHDATVQMLLNRPLPGYDAPIADAHAPRQTIPMPITIDNGATTAFSLAIAPGGQLDVIRNAVAPGAPPISAAPGCGDNAGSNSLSLTLGTGSRATMLTVNCSDSVTNF